MRPVDDASLGNAISNIAGLEAHLFPNPAAAAFTYTLPGESGNRNPGGGNLTIDMGVHKRFRILGPEKQTMASLHLASALEMAAGANLTSSTFGQYSTTLTKSGRCSSQSGIRSEGTQLARARAGFVLAG